MTCSEPWADMKQKTDYPKTTTGHRFNQLKEFLVKIHKRFESGVLVKRKYWHDCKMENIETYII